jgi:glycosyltransferase involved in cell wall biosynthesis
MIFAWLNKREWKNPGPIANMAVQNAHALASLGCETHLFLSAGDPDSNVAEDLRDFYGLDPLDGLHVHRFERWKIGQSKLAITVFLRAYRAIQELARRNKVAVVTRDATFLPLLAWLRQRLSIKGFYEAHDFYAAHFWRTGPIKISYRRQGWLERMFLPKIDGLICLTAAQQELYGKVLPRVCSCAIPLGTSEFPETDPEERRKQRTLIYIGRLTSEKGTKILFRALPKLAQNNVRVCFFGGWPDQIATARARLQKRGLEKWVDFVEFRPPAEFHCALQTTGSIGIAMLQENFYNRYLTCPVKALDYLSHGLPVIGSDLPSVREVAGEAGVYLAPDDSAGLVKAATALLDNPESYRRATEHARASARELSWQNRAVRIVEFVRESRSMPSPQSSPSGRGRRDSAW